MNPAPTATTATTAADILQRLGACQAAKTWAADRDPETAWRDCQRGDWLLWVAARSGIDRRLLVAAACQCARLALPHVPAGEHRPLAAIETAERWADGRATLDEVRAAAAASAAAVFASAVPADAAAVLAAAAAAAVLASAGPAVPADAYTSAVRAAAAADAVLASAYTSAVYTSADASAAAVLATLAECACRVRTVIPWATVAAAIAGARP